MNTTLLLKTPTAMSLALAAVLLVGASKAQAASYDLNLVPDGDSRWFEFYSDAFAQLDKGYGGDPSLDGAYLISADTVGIFDPNTFAPTAFTEIGGGADYFPNEAVFSNNYSVQYDGTALSGSGIETAPITSFSLAFENDIATGAAIIGGYTSTTGTAYGSVTLLDGVVVDVDGGATVTHIYDFSAFVGSALPYSGNFSIDGNEWNLDVDTAYLFSGTNLRYVWDAQGSVSNLTGVPEPSTALLVMFAGVSAAGLRRRSNS